MTHVKGCFVNIVLPIPGEAGCIVLRVLDKDYRNQLSNLFRLTTLGDIAWVARLPGMIGKDAYVDVKFTSDGLEANTWSGMWVLIDLSNGNILKSSFTK